MTCSAASPSSVSTTRPRIRAVRYGLSWSVIEIATRASRARLRAFCDAGCVKNAIRSPSSIPTHTATECGAPLSMSVATWPKFAPRNSARTSSFSSAMRACWHGWFRDADQGYHLNRLLGRKATRGWGLAAAVLAVAALASPSPATASQDPNPPWPQLLPPRPLTDKTQPGPTWRCHKATMRCFADTIARMRKLQARFGCDHRAVFATTYLLLTMQMRATIRRDPHFFHDRRWLIYEDTVFANFY